MHVPGHGPCHAPCHGHVPLELGLMELQREQLGQQLEHPLAEHVLERVLVVVRHGVVMVEAPIWRGHHVPRGLPEPNVELNQPVQHQHPEVMIRLEVVHASRALDEQAELARVVHHHLDQPLGVRETTCRHVSGEATAQELACRHQARLVSVLPNRQVSTIAQYDPQVNMHEHRVVVM